MTATRGRALIVNIRDKKSAGNFERRKGSLHDYMNLAIMFKKFGLIVSKLSGDRNWEAKVINELLLKWRTPTIEPYRRKQHNLGYKVILNSNYKLTFYILVG